ncbi:O-antigen ligase family protein [Cardiobacterium hominis]
MNALLPRLVNSATFLFFALSLAVKSGYSYGVALLLLAALIALPHWWPRRPHDAALRWLAFGFFFAGSVALLDVIRSGIGARGLEAPLKFFAVPLLLYFLATVPPKGRAIWAGAACGALLGLASAWYYSHFAPELLPAGRAARYLHPIQLGNIAMLLALIAACSLRARPRHWQLLLALAGIVAGVCTTLLSQTRGSFFALAWTLFFLGLLSLRRRHFRARSVALSATIVAITAALFWLGNMDVIGERLAAARHDIALYEQGKADTSIGARFEMWRFAWQEGSSYPLIGPGTAQLNVDKDGWRSAADLAPFGHLHNEFLDAFARRGLLGLAAVLYLFLVPLWLYRRGEERDSPDAAALRLAGRAQVLLYSGFSLTQAALYSHNSGFLFFALPLCLIYAALRGEGRPDV